MKIIKIVTGVIALTALTTTSMASENTSPSGDKAQQKISQYINGNLFGIQNIKKDANKRIVSLISIGRAPISSATLKARAKNQAFKKADAYARAEFMKWLQTAVVYTRIDEDDVAIVQKGESLGDAGKGKSSETSETIEISYEQTISVAAGFVKGMVQIGAGLNEDGEAVVVLGWSAEIADQTDVVRERNKKRSNDKCNECEAKGANATPNKSSSVSDSASDFL